MFFVTFISHSLWWLREWVVYISPSTDIVLVRKPAELSSVTSQVNRRTWWRGVVNKPPHAAVCVSCSDGLYHYTSPLHPLVTSPPFPPLSQDSRNNCCLIPVPALPPPTQVTFPISYLFVDVFVFCNPHTLVGTPMATYTCARCSVIVVARCVPRGDKCYRPWGVTMLRDSR